MSIPNRDNPGHWVSDIVTEAFNAPNYQNAFFNEGQCMKAIEEVFSQN